MIQEYKEGVLLNLKKTQGTLAKVQKLVDEEAYCMDVAQQINAAIGLLRSANNLIVESHLRTCGHRMAGKDLADRDQFIKEILQVCAVSNRKS